MNFGFVTVWSPGEIAEQQASLLASATSTNTTVQSCTGLDSSTSSAWSTFFQAVSTFCALEPAIIPFGSKQILASGTTADQLQSYQAQLFAWQQKLSPKCTSIVAVAPPTSLPGSTASSWTPLVKWASLGVAFLAGAYAVSKVAEVSETLALARSSRAVRRA